jgi:DNA polymerase-3 subunit alpha
LIKHIKDCREKGIKVCPPDVNNSGVNFTAGDGKIFYGLTSISKIGEGVAESIVREREENGKFKDFVDFRKRMMKNDSGINSGAIKNLIYAGAFDWTGYNRPTLDQSLADVDKALKNASKLDPYECQVSFFSFGETDVEQSPSEAAACKALKENACHDWDEMGKLRMEKEASGFYISGHPMETAETYSGITENKDVPFASIIDITGKKAKMDFSENMDDEDMDGYGLDDDDNLDTVIDVFEPDEAEDIEPKFKDKTVVTVQGIIVDMHEIITKKNQQMGFITIEDKDGNTLKVTAFPKLWIDDGVKQDFKEDDIVTILGEVSSYKGEYGLAARAIEDKDTIKEAIYVDFPQSYSISEKNVQDSLSKVKQRIAIEKSSSKSNVKEVLHPIYFRFNETQRKALHYKDSCVKITDCNDLEAFYPMLRQLYGNENVSFDIRSDRICKATEIPREKKKKPIQWKNFSKDR